MSNTITKEYIEKDLGLSPNVDENGNTYFDFPMLGFFVQLEVNKDGWAFMPHTNKNGSNPIIQKALFEVLYLRND